MKKILSVFFLIIIFISSVPAENSKGKIVVGMNNFRNNNGNAAVSLFTSEDGFPGDAEKAFKKGTAKIKNNRAEFTFIDIPFGRYAVSMHHDENSNNKMEESWIHIPKEGFGASNNPKSLFGPPDFKDAVFEFNEDSKTVTIEVQYF